MRGLHACTFDTDSKAQKKVKTTKRQKKISLSRTVPSRQSLEHLSAPALDLFRLQFLGVLFLAHWFFSEVGSFQHWVLDGTRLAWGRRRTRGRKMTFTRRLPISTAYTPVTDKRIYEGAGRTGTGDGYGETGVGGSR